MNEMVSLFIYEEVTNVKNKLHFHFNLPMLRAFVTAVSGGESSLLWYAIFSLYSKPTRNWIEHKPKILQGR